MKEDSSLLNEARGWLRAAWERSGYRDVSVEIKYLREYTFYAGCLPADIEEGLTE